MTSPPSDRQPDPADPSAPPRPQHPSQPQSQSQPQLQSQAQAQAGSQPLPSARTRARRRSRVGLALLLLGGLLVASEVALRLLDLDASSGPVTGHLQELFAEAQLLRADDRPGLSYSNTPDRAVQLNGRPTTHDERGRRAYPGPLLPDATPVVFLGDSTAYGLGVADDECLPAQTARRLGGAVLPLNLGVPGYNTHQELAFYRAEREHVKDAPLVVLLYYPNDATVAWAWDDDQGVLYYDGLPLPEGLKRGLWNSALYRALVSADTRRRLASGQLDIDRPENVDRAMEAVVELAREVHADGRRLLVAHLPGFGQLDPYQYAYQQGRLAALCAQQGLPYVDLLEPYLVEREQTLAKLEAGRRKPLSPLAWTNYLQRFWVIEGIDSHSNAEGYAVAAGTLADAVQEQLAQRKR